jgi:hypothetical protein
MLRASSKRLKAQEQQHDDVLRRLKKQQSDTLERVQGLEAMLKERFEH